MTIETVIPGDGPMGPENRKENRILLSIPVRYKVFDLQKLDKDVQDPNLGQEALLQNLSSGGLQVTSVTEFRAGDVLELEIDLPQEGRVRSVAKVVWCRKDGPLAPGHFHCGIQLIPVYESDLEKLNRYLDKGSK